MTADEERLTEKQAAALVADKVKELGSAAVAAQAWECTPQMVHMVVKGARRPTKQMLKALGIEKVPNVVIYRFKKKRQ